MTQFEDEFVVLFKRVIEVLDDKLERISVSLENIDYELDELNASIKEARNENAA